LLSLALAKLRHQTEGFSLATSVTLQRRVRIVAKLLVALLVGALFWLVGADVVRIFRESTELPVARSTSFSTHDAAQAVIAANLFGSATSAPSGEMLRSSLNLVVKGVYAAQGGSSGFAIVAIDGRADVGIITGSEIKPGVKLHAVGSDHILIARDGVVERVDLIFTKDATVKPGHFPGGESLNVRTLSPTRFSISRREFAPLVSDPRQLAMVEQLGISPNGGIVIGDAIDSAMMSKLGLKQGDVIKKINGKVIAGKEDLVKFALQSPATNEVSVEGVRNGKPLLLTYNVLP
jgi:type II secretory pathway component PulC